MGYGDAQNRWGVVIDAFPMSYKISGKDRIDGLAIELTILYITRNTIVSGRVRRMLPSIILVLVVWILCIRAIG